MTYIYDKTCPTIFYHLLILDVSQLSHHLSHLNAFCPSPRRTLVVSPCPCRATWAQMVRRNDLHPRGDSTQFPADQCPFHFDSKQILQTVITFFVFFVRVCEFRRDGITQMGAQLITSSMYFFRRPPYALGLMNGWWRYQWPSFLCTIWCPPLIWLGL